MLKTNLDLRTGLLVACNANELQNSAAVCSGTYVGQPYLLFKHEESHTSTVRELMKMVEPMGCSICSKERLKALFYRLM